MKISIDYLDLLYEEHFNAINLLSNLEKQQEFPDDEHVIRTHNIELENAKRNKTRTKNRIIAYLEHHH